MKCVFRSKQNKQDKLKYSGPLLPDGFITFKNRWGYGTMDLARNKGVEYIFPVNTVNVVIAYSEM